MTTLLFEKDLPEVLMRAENLPSLPAVALEVLRLTQDEKSTIEELASCLSRDPALAAKLLKLSNSSLFSMGQEVTSLERATVVLGLKTVKLMSLSFSLIDSIPSAGTEGGFDLAEFWRRSLISGVAGRSLARFIGSPGRDEAFLTGLLGHFGRLVLARCMTPEYEEVVRTGNGWPSRDLEERMLGFSSFDVCASVMKSWHLPSLIYMSIGYTDHLAEVPEDADPVISELVAILEYTGLVEQILCDEEKGQALTQLQDHLHERHSLSEEDVQTFMLGLESSIAETAEMLNVPLPSGKTHEDIMNEARVQIVNVSLGTAVDLRNARESAERLEDEKRRLKKRAETDRLTGLPNRGAFDDFLRTSIEERLEKPMPRALGLVMIDIDHFKSFNDTYGHQAGDEVLHRVGEALEHTTRKGDFPARYGGEEFAVIAPRTNTYGLRTLAERLRTAIAGLEIEFEGKQLSVTASLGAACIANFESADRDAQALIKLADQLLYKSKEGGRNRSNIYPRVRFPNR